MRELMWKTRKRQGAVVERRIRTKNLAVWRTARFPIRVSPFDPFDREKRLKDRPAGLLLSLRLAGVAWLPVWPHGGRCRTRDEPEALVAGGARSRGRCRRIGTVGIHGACGQQQRRSHQEEGSCEHGHILVPRFRGAVHAPMPIVSAWAGITLGGLRKWPLWRRVVSESCRNRGDLGREPGATGWGVRKACLAGCGNTRLGTNIA